MYCASAMSTSRIGQFSNRVVWSAEGGGYRDYGMDYRTRMDAVADYLQSQCGMGYTEANQAVGRNY